MLTYAFLGLIAVAVLMALRDWRQGVLWGIAVGSCDLAGLRMVQGDYRAACSSYEACLQHASVIGDKLLIASCLEGLASAVVAQAGEAGPVAERLWAAQLWGAAEHVREAIAAPIPPVQRATYEHALARARCQVDEATFRTAWGEGHRSTPQQVLAARPAARPPEPVSVPPRSPVSKPDSAAARLTTREREVLRLLSEGLTNPQIAERLVVSLPTVNKHVASIFNKLGVNSRSAATRVAVEQHLI